MPDFLHLGRLRPKIFYPVLVLLAGILLTWFSEEAARQTSQRGWEQRYIYVGSNYNNDILKIIDINISQLGATASLIVGSDDVTNEEFLEATAFLSQAHRSVKFSSYFSIERNKLDSSGSWSVQLQDGRFKSVFSGNVVQQLEKYFGNCESNAAPQLLPTFKNAADENILTLCLAAPLKGKNKSVLIIVGIPLEKTLNTIGFPEKEGMQYRLTLLNVLGQNLQLKDIEKPNPDAFHFSQQVKRVGHQWQFDWQADPALLGSPNMMRGMIMLAGGGFASLFASLLLFSLLNSYEKLRREVISRKQIARDMEAERNRSILYLNTVEVVVVALDLDGRITLANRKMCALLGYAEDELIGMDFRQLIPKNERPQIDDYFCKLIKAIEDIPDRLNNKNHMQNNQGKLIFLEWNNTVLRDDQGKPVGLLCAGEDITEKHRLEQAFYRLASSFSRLEGEKLFEKICSYLCEELGMDIGFVGQYRNAANVMEAIVGYSVDSQFKPFSYALDNTPCADVMNKNVCAYACNVTKKYPLDTMLQDFGISGYIAAALHDRSNQPIGIVVLLSKKPIVNIGFAKLLLNCFVPRLEAELERRAEQKRLQISKRIFDSSKDGYFVIDFEGRTVEINPAFSEISGYTLDELKNKRLSYILLPSTEHTHSGDQLRYLVLNQRFWSGELEGQRKSGEIFTFNLRINAIYGDDGKVEFFCGSVTDISNEKAALKAADNARFYDKLTGLPNRTMLSDKLTSYLQPSEAENKKIAVLQLDLDNFKLVNDALGFAAGDILIIQICARLKNTLDDNVLIARIGGDDFMIIVPDIDSSIMVRHIAEQVQKSFQQSFLINGQNIYASASIGIAMFPADGDCEDTLFKSAEIALYRSKEMQRGGFAFFNDTMSERNLHRLTMEHELRIAIEQQQLVAWFQPKYCLDSSSIVGFEALIRWMHPTRGMIPPLDFIPLAEETGLIIPIGELVLQQACAQLKALHDTGFTSLEMAVNLSPKQFVDKKLVSMIASVLADHQLPGGCLEMEITESAAMTNPEEAIATMHQLRELGVMISIDDFGTGYSSLSYLKRFPLHTLKIDQSFVRELTLNSDDAGIVAAIISLAKVLNLKVIAEGVETQEQFDYLKSQDCNFAQGYLLSKPLPPTQIEKLLIK
jgi:diguanylate cyclase (GGDEF)-like protein/PAS domain S-box-containing protein